MSRLILLGLFCALVQNSFAALSTTPPVAGVNYEYIPPPAKSDSDLFLARLEPTSGENVTVAQFMYHLKQSTYATGFKTEVFTLGIHTHLFTDEQMAYPSDEDRRIAIAAVKLWSTLAGMRAMDRVALQVANETAHRYLLQPNDRIDTISYAFSKLQDLVLADPAIGKTYAQEKRHLDLVALPHLEFVNINITKFGSIDRTLKKSVWTDPKSFVLVANERFLQHLETNVDNATTEDYPNVVLAHSLEQAALESETKEDAEKVYEDGIAKAVKSGFDHLKSKDYTEFDRVLFASLNKVIKAHSKLEKKLVAMKKRVYRIEPSPKV